MKGIEPVTRKRRVQSGKDRYGVPIYDLESQELPKALFAPGGTVPAAEVGRQPTVVEPTLYWHNVWPDVVASDVLNVRGRDYEVASEPADWRGPVTGGLSVTLKDSTEAVA